MMTMQPVLILGSHHWDPEALPREEFDDRLGAVREQMRAHGWHGLIVHGDAEQSPMLSWLTNFSPRLRWVFCTVGPEGEPQLLPAGATRDLPAARKLTWCKSVESYEGAVSHLSTWMGQLGSSGVSAKPMRIAVYGLSRMRSAVRETLERVVGQNAELCDAEAVLDALSHPKRARELGVTRQAHAILAQASEQLCQVWRDGKPICEAVLQAELVARRAEAHDVRILFSVDGGRTLRPFEDIDSVRSATLVCYIAVRYLGYWAETFVTRGVEETPVYRAAIDILGAFLKAAAPGVKGRQLFDRALPFIGAFEWHPMLGGSCGHGVGLVLEEGEARLSPDSGDAMIAGAVYSLQVGLVSAAGQCALVSATVHVTAAGAQPLYVDSAVETALAAQAKVPAKK
jgi:Xaa-Pro aminopeptidase